MAAQDGDHNKGDMNKDVVSGGSAGGCPGGDGQAEAAAATPLELRGTPEAKHRGDAGSDGASEQGIGLPGGISSVDSGTDEVSIPSSSSLDPPTPPATLPPHLSPEAAPEVFTGVNTEPLDMTDSAPAVPSDLQFPLNLLCLDLVFSLLSEFWSSVNPQHAQHAVEALLAWQPGSVGDRAGSEAYARAALPQLRPLVERLRNAMVHAHADAPPPQGAGGGGVGGGPFGTAPTEELAAWGRERMRAEEEAADDERGSDDEEDQFFV